VTRVDDYRATLRALATDWEPYLIAESRLPGPRANLELAHAAALEGDPAQLTELRRSDHEFAVMCGVMGLDDFAELRRWANDPRWRVREAVAMAVQRIGGAAAVEHMRAWANGTRLEQRAAVAALCEPPLLADESVARAALEVLDAVTASLAEDRGDPEGEKALRKALAYGWSVAVVALPDPGRALMERWIADGDAGTRRIMRENLRKARLARADGEWVERQLARI
jgi:hypothetical protein